MSKVSRENVALVAWEALREAGTPFVRLLRAANDALEATLKALGGKAAFQQAFASIDKSDEGLAKAFKKVDVDSSGYISAAEISAHVASVYGPMDESITTKMLKAADTDGDGEISLDEFKTVMRAGPDVKADGTLEDGTPLQEDVEDAVDADAPLTKQELEWIVAIRDAAATQSLPCTNVELVQLAIVTKGDTAKALSRLKKMAAWKKDLGLDEITFADAFRKVNATVTTSGYGYLTPYGRAQSGSTALCAWYSEFLPAETEYQSAFKAIIGVFEACTSSLADARRGICIIAECSGVGYSNVSLRTELKFASLYVGGYPVRIERIVLVDVTMLVRVVLKALKRALPAKMRSKFRLSSTANDELYEQHAGRDELPDYLGGGYGGDGGGGGGGGSGDSGALHVEKALAYWSQLHKARAAWEAELVKAYGVGFKELNAGAI